MHKDSVVRVCYYIIQITQISLAIFIGVIVTKARQHCYISSLISCGSQATKNPKIVFPTVLNTRNPMYRKGGWKKKWQLYQVGLRNLPYLKGLQVLWFLSQASLSNNSIEDTQYWFWEVWGFVLFFCVCFVRFCLSRSSILGLNHVFSCFGAFSELWESHSLHMNAIQWINQLMNVKPASFFLPWFTLHPQSSRN